MCPGKWIRLSGRPTPGVRNSIEVQNPTAGKMLTLLVYQPENQILVLIISTISMHQNCSLSFLAAQAGSNKKSAHLGGEGGGDVAGQHELKK